MKTQLSLVLGERNPCSLRENQRNQERSTRKDTGTFHIRQEKWLVELKAARSRVSQAIRSPREQIVIQDSQVVSSLHLPVLTSPVLTVTTQSSPERRWYPSHGPNQLEGHIGGSPWQRSSPVGKGLREIYGQGLLECWDSTANPCQLRRQK